MPRLDQHLASSQERVGSLGSMVVNTKKHGDENSSDSQDLWMQRIGGFNEFRN
jgi:hypothetical protein